MGLFDRLFGAHRKGESAADTAITYRVGVNETCRSLARRFYGDETQWPRIYEANQRRIGDDVQTGTAVLPPGIELTIRDPQFDVSRQLERAG